MTSKMKMHRGLGFKSLSKETICEELKPIQFRFRLFIVWTFLVSCYEGFFAFWIYFNYRNPSETLVALTIKGVGVLEALTLTIDFLFFSSTLRSLLIVLKEQIHSLDVPSSKNSEIISEFLAKLKPMYYKNLWMLRVYIILALAGITFFSFLANYLG